MRDLSALRVLAAAASLAAAGATGAGQTPAESPGPPVTLEIAPEALTVAVGESRQLTATVRDAHGAVVEGAPVVYFSRSRQNVGVTRSGVVEAYRPGKFVVVALVPRDASDRSRRAAAPARVEVPVTVPLPPVAAVTLEDVPPAFYVGTHPRLRAQVLDTLDVERTDVPVVYTTSDAAVASIDRFGSLTLLRPGPVEVMARAETVEARLAVDVVPNPIRALTLEASTDEAYTGDVIRFMVRATDGEGAVVPDVPVRFTVAGETDPAIIAPGAAVYVTSNGRFVAERSGTYTVVASAGSRAAARTVAIAPREVARAIEVVGRGSVLDRHTSDLWVWEAADGRDYAITGTWGAAGHVYLWDVTDPTDIRKVEEVQVDARTVNDVKVSAAGDVAVIGREGASDRRNGVVLLGVGQPAEGVPVLSEFTDQLTGGVHNLFIDGDHVYALSASRRYDVIDIADPRSPQRVGRFELDAPGRSVHDVWVSDGIAYSSNWRDGVVAVDVGGGGRGGSPAQPVELGRYSYPSGWTHAAFPYASPATGRFYVFAGDEWFPPGGFRSQRGSIPSDAEGWIHVIDWTDWEAPREVARYQVPEAGSHNLWVENDILYVGYYGAGLRVVDVSGELLGDLYRQGREIARYVPYDPDGYIPNAPFVWGAQPYKGHIFFTDWNTGLWAVKLAPVPADAPIVGEPQ